MIAILCKVDFKGYGMGKRILTTFLVSQVGVRTVSCEFSLC